ncbi:MAG TPA: nuclear transport factor 2 family protein [Mycobacteriales bacterium]|nr:nuclear transport factor 2 family protein [Mycobacteriales bacterium]
MTAGERRELHELVERYAQAVDRVDGTAVSELFVEDGVLATWMDPATGTSTGEQKGRQAIATAVNGLSRYVATHHTISSHSSTVDGAQATGESLCTAHHVVDEGGKRHDRVLYIRYLDTFVRASGPWLFSRREVHVQWVSTLPVDSAAARTRSTRQPRG